MKKIEKNQLFEIIFILAICSFPLWFRIDHLVLRQWDESRNAVNAIEMYQNGHYFVRYFQGQPETWEVKPPLLIWLQVISMHIFGLNEFAIRFPSLISSFGIILLIIGFFHFVLDNRIAGYLAAFVLISSPGFLDRHFARTGDHEALLVLLMMSIMVWHFKNLKTKEPFKSNPVIPGILFALAVLAKSTAVLLMLPGMIISIIALSNWKAFFLSRKIIWAVMTFIVITGSYYLIREHLQPGYLKLVWHWEGITQVYEHRSSA